MSVTTKYLYGDEECTDLANQTKNIFLRFLQDEGYLPPEKIEELDRDYTIIIQKPSRMSSFWQRLFKRKDEESCFVVAKIMNSKDLINSVERKKTKTE